MTFFATTLLFAAVFAVLVSRSHAAAGFLAPCRTDSQCTGLRECRKITPYAIDANTGIDFASRLSVSNGIDVTSILSAITSQRCDSSAKYCVCVSDTLEDEPLCSNDNDCPEKGESCATNCIADAQKEAFVDINASGNILSAVCPNPTRCPSERQCVPVVVTADSTFSLCLARFSSPSSPGDANGEAEGNSGDGEGGDSSEVCIAAQSLSHLAPHELLYTKHVSARVLCDAHQSCATAGHMVRYHGEVMMMKTYCARIGGCTRSIMHVNSPRYRRALQIASDTPHLTFTALAARYGTNAEEHVLRTAVRLGL